MSEQPLRGELKLFLIEYFDGVQFEIDIEAQKLLEKLEDGSQKREAVLKMNLDMVDKVKEIYEKNSKAVDDYFNSREQLETNNLEELKSIILNGFCIFYSKEDNDWTCIIMGMLIVTDFYLDQNQLNYLRCFFKIFLEYL
jgi:hypothetical protein